MVIPSEAALPVIDVKERVIIALDVDSADAAREIADDLAGEVGAFKVGLQLYAAEGPELVRELVAAGHKIFLDLKFHDIPNTVAKAAVEAARLGVWMFNVHASGGAEMMRAATRALDEVCDDENVARPLCIAVTVLTSSSQDDLADIGVGGSAEEQVLRLAKLAAASGMDGVVASALEADAVRNLDLPSGFLIVTPGIRSTIATGDDQRRVTTPGQAIAAGSSYVVIGRPVTGADDRRAALAELLSQC